GYGQTPGDPDDGGASRASRHHGPVLGADLLGERPDLGVRSRWCVLVHAPCCDRRPDRRHDGVRRTRALARESRCVAGSRRAARHRDERRRMIDTTTRRAAFATAILVVVASVCVATQAGAQAPLAFDPHDFNHSATVDNNWLPLRPGTRLVYTGSSSDG